MYVFLALLCVNNWTGTLLKPQPSGPRLCQFLGNAYVVVTVWFAFIEFSRCYTVVNFFMSFPHNAMGWSGEYMIVACILECR